MANKNSTRKLDAYIRDRLGHGSGNRKVVVSNDGRILYYGSTTDTDRQHDYWHFGGFRNDYLAEYVQDQENQ